MRVCVCVCVFGSVPSSHLIADKELETEKKQNEAELTRGRVYYEKIKDQHKIVPSNGICFLLSSSSCERLFPLSLFRLNITVPIHFLSSVILHQIAFGGSTWNFPGIAPIMSRMPPPENQKRLWFCLWFWGPKP